ncbi:HD domain-containing protein [Treponema parvum]|uniref:bis(5'-nucleosyl)-tetraphosphatase (symmetrical) n=1 Tax=Treponema parvum TaxID=138851 RepID=A0A975F487_9SPIR|nr:bis(5'-nucleosyl)-tetraphosphatase (symmetrical) YqeK [Treponema parvum]QTQ14329.1 HD domain-containing protein [Treponema parvum]
MDVKLEDEGPCNKKRLCERSSILQVIERVRRYAFKALSKKRYEHSVRVAETAKKMCVLYGIDPDLGYLAGIAHDICKEMKDEDILSLALRDGDPVTEVEKSKLSLLHGRAAAVMLRDDFGINDKELLQSVACHTFGDPSLSRLGKIIYAADKIEPGRGHVSAEYLDRLFSLDLDHLVKTVLSEAISYVKEKKYAVSPQSIAFLKKIEEDIAAENKFAAKKNNECASASKGSGKLTAHYA